MIDKSITSQLNKFRANVKKIYFENLTPEAVILTVLLYLARPELINQGDTSLCGPCAIITILAKDDPKIFTALLLQFAKKGKAIVKGKVISNYPFPEECTNDLVVTLAKGISHHFNRVPEAICKKLSKSEQKIVAEWTKPAIVVKLLDQIGYGEIQESMKVISPSSEEKEFSSEFVSSLGNIYSSRHMPLIHKKEAIIKIIAEPRNRTYILLVTPEFTKLSGTANDSKDENAVFERDSVLGIAALHYIVLLKISFVDGSNDVIHIKYITYGKIYSLKLSIDSILPYFLGSISAIKHSSMDNGNSCEKTGNIHDMPFRTLFMLTKENGRLMITECQKILNEGPEAQQDSLIKKAENTYWNIVNVFLALGMVSPDTLDELCAIAINRNRNKIAKNLIARGARIAPEPLLVVRKRRGWSCVKAYLELAPTQQLKKTDRWAELLCAAMDDLSYRRRDIGSEPILKVTDILLDKHGVRPETSMKEKPLSTLCQGDECTVVADKKEYHAKILCRDGDNVTVHYVGWPEEYNEQISLTHQQERFKDLERCWGLSLLEQAKKMKEVVFSPPLPNNARAPLYLIDKLLAKSVRLQPSTENKQAIAERKQAIVERKEESEGERESDDTSGQLSGSKQERFASKPNIFEDVSGKNYQNEEVMIKQSSRETIKGQENQINYINIKQIDQLKGIIGELIANINGTNVNTSRVQCFTLNRRSKINKITALQNWLGQTEKHTDSAFDLSYCLLEKLCSIKRNPIGFFDPHSSAEFKNMTKDSECEQCFEFTDADINTIHDEGSIDSLFAAKLENVAYESCADRYGT